MKIYFSGIEDKKLKHKLNKIYNYACKILGQNKRILSVELGYISASDIKALNKEKRDVDKVTDVLSFPMLNLKLGEIVVKKNYIEDVNPFDKKISLGSIVINPDRASEQAQNYGHSFEREVCFLALHGLLHLFGFDHIQKDDEEIMMMFAEKILNKFKITRGEDKNV